MAPRKKKEGLEQLSSRERDFALDAFAELLPNYFARRKQNATKVKEGEQDDVSKTSIMEEVAKKLQREFNVKRSLHSKQFEKFLDALHEGHYLKITPRILSGESVALQQKFSAPLREAIVVAGSSTERFFDVAAKKFVREIARVAEKKPKSSELCVGLTSGTTTKGVVNRAIALDWLRDVAVDPTTLPPIKLFPLNVSFTDPQYLSGNATILTFNLAEHIRAQGGRADAFGLNAPLAIEKTRLDEVDKVAQTQRVLEYTDPARVEGHSDKAESKLDVVLLGAGERPKGEEDSGSIFFTLAKQNLFPIKEFIETNHVVGDLALMPLCSNGLPAKLKDAKGTEFVFYQTIRLEVLESLASDTNKSVILVAQSSEQKYKIPVIFASIGGATNHDGRKCYVSRLIVDEPTARELLRF